MRNKLVPSISRTEPVVQLLLLLRRDVQVDHGARDVPVPQLLLDRGDVRSVKWRLVAGVWRSKPFTSLVRSSPSSSCMRLLCMMLQYP